MFDKLKDIHMKKYRIALEKGEVDEPIIFLLDYINSLKDYFTTSSCAGRIVLMKIPKSGRKNEAEFLFKTHYEVNFDEIWKRLLEVYDKYEESIWFKQEPFILHISARNLDYGYKMLRIAQKAGLKHSGIFLISEERVMIEIQSTERIETIVSKNRKLLVDEEFFRILVNEANKKLMKTREKMKRFYDMLKKNLV